MTSWSLAELAAQDERLPVHQRVAALVTGKVSSGELLPGDALPPEDRLAVELKVSVGTVRRAMHTLQEVGIIERHQGRGTFVRRPDFSSSMLRFFRFGDRTGGAVPSGRVLSISNSHADATTAAALGVDVGSPIIELTRVRSVDQVRVLWECIWLPPAQFDGLLDEAPDNLPDLLYPWYQDRFGVLVSRAEEILTVESANDRDAELLGVAAGEPMVVVDRTATTLDGSHVERRITRGLASTFRYRVEIS